MLSKVAAYAEANHHRAVRLRVQEPDGEWLFGVNPDGTGFELADDTEPPAQVLAILLCEIMRRFHQR